MRIVFLTASLSLGGAERQLTSLARGLKRKGHEIEIITFYGTGFFDEELVKLGIKVNSLKKNGRWDLFFPFFRLLKLLKNVKPDILHGYLITPNLVAALCCLIYPEIKLVWGVRYSKMEVGRYDVFTQATYFFHKRLLNLPKLLIVNSVAGKSMLLNQGAKSQKVTVIHNGIDCDEFKGESVDRVSLLTKWGLRNDEIIIGMIARLDPMKDHETLFESAKLLIKQNPKIKFVCIGSGDKSFTEMLERRIMEDALQDSVKLVGKINNISAVYGVLDLCVLCSSYGEGFPNVLGEAMASGIRCVATESGDTAEVIGGTGVVVPVRRPDLLAKAIIEILNNPPEESPRERVMRKFSVVTLIKTTEEALLRLCSEQI